jgi:acyl transferase domain-containing protein
MLSVPASEDVLAPLLGDALDLAAVNTPGLCVVSGPGAPLDALARTLAEQGIAAQRVHITAAGHSRLLDPVLGSLEACLRRLPFQPPTIPFVSNRTGTWITEAQATDPAYWVRQFRETVRFADGIGTLLEEPDRVFLEVGPGQTLSTFVRLHPRRQPGHLALPSLRHPLADAPDLAVLLQALGRLWLSGVEIDWKGYYARERRRRVPLPTYPFARTRYWMERDDASGGAGLPRRRPAPPFAALRRWFHQRTRRRTPRDASQRPRSDAPRPAPPPAAAGTTGTAPAAAPRTPTQRRLAAVWQEVLGVAPLGLYDNFFELGGNSLLATQTIARINETFQTDLAVLSLLESPTVAELAECIEAVRPFDKHPAAV